MMGVSFMPSLADSAKSAHNLDPGALAGMSVIYFGNDWFAENRTSSHHISRQLSRRLPLLYIDAPGMRAPTASSRDLKKISRVLGKFLAAPQQIGQQMWHITMPQLPWRKLPFIDLLNRALGRWLVLRAARRLGFKRRLSWFAVPHPGALAGRVGDEFIVYYCIDDYAAFAQMDAKRIQGLDDALARRADLVFVSSTSLLEGKRGLARQLEYSPHGVDFELFSKAQDPATVVAPAARNLKHPVIGYFGSIAHHTNLEMIEEMARARPAWTFILIGMASVDTSALTALPNVVLPGPQRYETLATWAKAFDAAIIPYRPWFALHSSSLKVREYLAAGVPVVTVSTPEIERYKDVISIASNTAEFLAALDCALATNSPRACLARFDAVKDSTWEGCATRAFNRVTQAFADR
jgi:glycosyltransferase involved in cell wall biosynthesis